MPHLDENGRWHATPDFKNDLLAKSKYIEREAIRWRDGFKNTQGEVIMEGLMYFYLTVGILKDLTGKVFQPKWRDGDFLVINSYLEAKKNNKNLLIIKRREFGLTSIFGGGIPFYNCVTRPGTVNILTSANETRLKDIRENKIQPYKQGLVELDILPPNNIDNPDLFSFKPRGSKNTEKKYSQILMLDTNKDDKAAANMESQRAYYIFLDEYFLHNRAELVLMSARASMKKGEKQIGTMVLGGSCNNINPLSVPRLRRLLTQHKAFNLDILFIPATFNYEPYEERIGESWFSLHDKAKEAILKERDELRSQHAYDILTNTIKSYPLSLKDLTSSEDANIISPDAVSVLEKSREICMTMETENYKYRLYTTNTGIFPDQNPNDDGFSPRNYVIFQHPQPGHEYIAGMDPIPFTIGASDKGSDLVCIIKDRNTNQYVAYLSMRTGDPEHAFAEWERLLMYYKSPRYPRAAPCNIERNRGEVIMHMAKFKQKEYLMAWLPGQKHPGYTKAGKEGELLHSCMINYLKYCGTICIPKFLDDMMEYPVIDSHIIDALQACELFDSFRNNQKAEEQQQPRLVKKIIRDGSGRTTTTWEQAE